MLRLTSSTSTTTYPGQKAVHRSQKKTSSCFARSILCRNMIASYDRHQALDPIDLPSSCQCAGFWLKESTDGRNRKRHNNDALRLQDHNRKSRSSSMILVEIRDERLQNAARASGGDSRRYDLRGVQCGCRNEQRVRRQNAQHDRPSQTLPYNQPEKQSRPPLTERISPAHLNV